MTKKLTKKDLYEMLFVVVAESDDPDKEMLCDFITHELALLAKKSASHRTPTATQLENVLVKESILATLEQLGESRATAVAENVGISVQKCSALLRQLVTEKSVTRVEDKKVVTFKVS